MRSHNPYAAASGGAYRVPQLRDPATDLDAPAIGVSSLHVVALVDRYPPLVNAGGESMLASLLEPLAREGHRCSVITQTRLPYARNGVEVHPRSARDEVCATADVMVGHLMWTREAVETAARLERPLVYLVHNHRQLRHWSLLPENMTVLVVNSVELAEQVQTPRQRGRPDSWSRGLTTWAGPSAVIRPPCRAEDWPTVPQEQRQYVTLVNVQPAKGSDLFYDLAARPNRRRWLAVEGGYGDQRRPDHRTPGVEWQPQTADMHADVYSRTAVLLMPSDYESWGLAAVEALHCGIPVVAHPTTGLRESLADGAVFIDRDDTDAWAAELDRLDDPAYYLLRSAAAHARSRVLDAQAATDADRWVRVIAAAAAAGVPSGR